MLFLLFCFQNTQNFEFFSFLCYVLVYCHNTAGSAVNEARLVSTGISGEVYRAVNLTLTILLGKPLSIKLNSNTSVVLFPDAVSCADIWFPTESNFKPYVDEEVKRQHFSGTELLKKGTTVTASSPNHFQSKPENATSLRTGNLHCSQTEKVTINEESHWEDQLPLENFSYAMEDPLATGYPKSTHQQNETCAVFKGNACTDDIEEEERKQVLNRPTSTLLTPTNLSLGKISEKK